MYPISAPELTAELNAAPAYGADVTSAPAVSDAETEMAEEISLTIDDAVAIGLVVTLVILTSLRIAGSLYLPRRLRSPGANDGIAVRAELGSEELQFACQEPILALVAATHFPDAGTDPTRLEHS